MAKLGKVEMVHTCGMTRREELIRLTEAALRGPVAACPVSEVQAGKSAAWVAFAALGEIDKALDTGDTDEPDPT